MACFDPQFIVRCQNAERMWAEAQQRKDRDEIEDSLRIGFSKELRAINIAADYLSSKNVSVVKDRSGSRIDYQNPEEVRYLYIADTIDRICNLNPDEAKIALEMKESRLVAQEKIANDMPSLSYVFGGIDYIVGLAPAPLDCIGQYAMSHNNGSQSFQPNVPVTAEELLHIWPDGIPVQDIPFVMRLHLDERARQAVNLNVAVELAALSKLVKRRGDHEELDRTNLPIREAGAVLPQHPEEVLVPNGPNEMVSDISEQSEASPEKETRASDLAKKLTSGLVQMVTAYHAIDGKDQRYREERRRLREGFEYVCKDFGMQYNLDTFAHRDATQISQLFHVDRVTETLAERARQIHDLSVSVSKNVSDLQKELQVCRDAHSTYTALDRNLTSLSRKLANLYDKKLKDLERKAKGFSIIQAAASLCSDLPGFSELSQVAGIAGAHIDAKRNRRMQRYTDSLSRSEEGKRMIGVLDSQTVVKMTALMASEREEQDRIISIREHLDSVVYLNLLTDLSRGYAEQKKEVKDELDKEERSLKEMEEEKKRLQNAKPYDEKERDLKLLEIEIEASKGRIKNGQTSLASLDATISQNSLERELAIHVTPISNIKREILQELLSSLPDEKTLRTNQEFRAVFKLLNDSIKEGFSDRQQLLECLRPLINNLQAFSVIRESSFGKVLNQAGITLKIGSDLNALSSEILTLHNFVRVVDAKGKSVIPWNIIFTQLIIPLSSSLAIMTSIMHTIHTINNPEKDPMNEALAMLGEDILKVQKELFQNQLRALSDRYDTLSQEIQDSARKVITEFNKGQAVIVDVMFTIHEYNDRADIFKLTSDMARVESFEVLVTHLNDSKMKELNGVSHLTTFAEETRFMVKNPYNYTGYLFQAVSKQNDLPPNLSLFKAIVARAVQLSKRGRSEMTESEMRYRDSFLRNAQEEISKLYQLSKFSLTALERALESLKTLRTRARNLSSEDSPDPLDSVTGLKCDVAQFASMQLEGSKKFVSGYWGDINVALLYDKKVKEMHGTYFKELSSTKEIVLPSSSGNLVPLIFPRHYIAALERDLVYIRRKLAYLNAGTLTLSSYDFKPSNGRLELILQWKVTVNEVGGSPRPYIEAVVASFDSMSVNAFKNKSEFLIQAMHCGKYGLGLPGKGSTEKENGKLYVVERKFIGLYPFFHSREENGMMGFFYNSEDLNGALMLTTGDFKQSCAIEPYNAFGRRVKFDIDEKGFFAVEAAVMGRSNQLRETDAYKEYRRDYHVLQALCRLQLGARTEDLQREMLSHFSLLPLDYRDFLQEGPLPPSDLVVSAWNFNRAMGNGEGLPQELKKLEEDLKSLIAT